MTTSRVSRCDLRRSRLLEKADGLGLSLSTLDEQGHESPDLQVHERPLTSFPHPLHRHPHLTSTRAKDERPAWPAG
jgi:hypothetical protein